MESSACPVCTLFLRQGISLEEHLETHPKDQVIEALVNSIRNRDTEPQHLTNGYAMQALPLRSTQYYELPSQCLPIQSYQSSTIAYQQILPNNPVPPISPSPYVPVTMFMASSGTPNQPALMQMVCNPYNVMQIQQQQQQQQPVQLANQRSSGHTQQSGFPKPLASPLSNSSSSSQHTHNMSGIKPATGVSSTLHSFSNSLHNNNDLQDGSATVDALQSPCSNTDNRNSSSAPSSNRSMGSPPRRLSNTEEIQPSTVRLEDGNQSAVAIPKILPILRGSSADATAISSGLTNRVRVIRVLPPPENLCLDPKLRKSTASLPSDTANSIPITFPRKVIGLSHTTETGEIYKSMLPGNNLQSLRSELRDLVTTYNSNDGSTVQESEYIDLPPFDSSSVDNVTYRLNFPRSSLTSSKVDAVNSELENSNSSSQQNSVNKVPDVRDCQVDKSPPVTLKPMDIELSRINLTDLSNKPCSSKPNERVDASTSNLVNSFDELSTEASNSAFQNPKSPTLRVRTDLNKIENKDEDEVSDGHDEEVPVRVPQQSSLSPRKSACSGPFLDSLDSESNPKSSSPRRSSVSPGLLRVSVSPKLNNELASCDSSRKSLSPGLRIRTDLSSVPVGSDTPMNLQERHLKAQHLLSQLDSNEVTAVLGMVRSSLEIQLPPVSVPDNDEYITSDCNYNAEDDMSNRLTDQGTSVADETKAEVSSPLKPKTLFSNFHRSSSSDEVVSFEPSSPVNIIEIDGIHIIVPRQFYEDQHDGLANDRPTTHASQPPSDRNEGQIDTQLEITPLQNVSHRADRRLSLREILKKKDYAEDTEVSTSYDLLARESWAASDGSDADCRPPTPPAWEPAPPPTPRYGKGKAGRLYKCITCGATFDCPKERRVHCVSHRSEKPAEPVKAASEAPRAPRAPAKRPKRGRKGCQVLFVRNEPTSFMGVFVKDTGEENKMESEGGAPPPVDSKEEGSELKREVREMPDEKNDVKTLVEPKAEKTVQCMTCSEMFQSKKHLQQHVRLSHKGGEWKHMCDRCQEVFTTELLYNEHLKIHPLECKQCSKNFYRRQNLLVHTKRHLGIKPHKCNACEKAFVTKQKLNEHQNSHTGAAPIKCPLCPMSFRRYSNLIQHKNRLHYKMKKKVKDFVCHCGDVFHSRKKLDWHKETHEDRPKSCPFCSERFVHAASLTRHIRRAHDRRYVPPGAGRERENVECPVCGRAFLGASLAVHMRLHAGERPHACAVCGKTFATRWNLQQHRWVHAARSAKPFKCSLCKGAFAREVDYAQHMDAHRNRRPYTCNVCGERFVRKPNCVRHMREHEAGKAFFCGECGKSFHRGYYLKDHMRVHTGVRPHVCHICGKASSTKSNHNKHVKIHHAREPVNTES